MEIAIDLDDTLCKGVKTWPVSLSEENITEFYNTCVPIPEAVDKVQKLKDAGHSITIYTSRWYEDEVVTLDWLRTHHVPFDKLVMAKERCDLYIDNQSATMEEVIKDDTIVQRRNGQLHRLSLSEKT